MLPGFTAELSCGPAASYRGGDTRWTASDGGVTPQMMMHIPYWDQSAGGGQGAWSSVNVDVPDDPHGPAGRAVDPGAVQCRARCYRIANLVQRRACLADC